MTAGEVPQTKAEYAANALRKMVQSGSLAPGTPVNVDEIARTLGISPTPVREAVRQLQAEGLLTHSPHRSVKVASLSPADLIDIYRIRAALEGLAAELAAEQMAKGELARLRRLHEKMVAAVESGNTGQLRGINDEFHLVINRGARSPRLERLISSLWRAAPVDTFVAIPQRGPLSVQDHRAILDALTCGSAAAAAAAMRAHIEGALALLLSHIAGRGPTDSGTPAGRPHPS